MRSLVCLSGALTVAAFTAGNGGLATAQTASSSLALLQRPTAQRGQSVETYRIPRRRDEGKLCTEVVFEGLPPGAEIDTVLVFAFRKADSISPEENGVVEECHSRSQATGAIAFPPSSAEDSVERRVAALAMNVPTAAQRAEASFALHPNSRLRLMADASGTARMFVPFENMDPIGGVILGYAMANLGLIVRVKDPQGSVLAQSNVVLVGGGSLVGKDQAKLSVVRGQFGNQVKWTDASGAPLRFNGQAFTDARGRPLALSPQGSQASGR